MTISPKSLADQLLEAESQFCVLTDDNGDPTCYGPLDWKTAKRMAQQLAKAYQRQHSHEKPVVYDDPNDYCVNVGDDYWVRALRLLPRPTGF